MWSRRAGLACAGLVSVAIALAASADFYEGLGAYDRGDYERAYREWLPLAEAGDASSQANLGVLYWRGQGVGEDHAEAVRWFRLAAEQGNPIAQDNLGQMYYLGQGVEQSDADAARWIRAAALQGDANAQLRLGSLYAEGIGVARDSETAIDWWRKSADQGNAEAGVRLGIAYERGEGVVKDPERARAWFERAARAQGLAPDPLVRPGVPAEIPADVPPAALADADSRSAEAAQDPGEARAAAARDVMIQLGSVRSVAEAQAEWDRLRGRHSDLLGELELRVERVDLGERGVFQRIRAGPLPDLASAAALCEQLWSRRLQCLVALGP